MVYDICVYVCVCVCNVRLIQIITRGQKLCVLVSHPNTIHRRNGKNRSLKFDQRDPRMQETGGPRKWPRVRNVANLRPLPTSARLPTHHMRLRRLSLTISPPISPRSRSALSAAAMSALTTPGSRRIRRRGHRRRQSNGPRRRSRTRCPRRSLRRFRQIRRPCGWWWSFW